ncbi:nucleotidyltransferase family protein [Spirosoma sp. SC4-14]|uniref:nucleotidyltransferase family protein n=1 Tax=Spirosoma sp. SC4-14 TaxID=3128900 RepID=UPI0030CA70C1
MADRSAEIRFLLMACALELSASRKKQLGDFLAQYPLDWKRVYGLAKRHRLIPYLCRTLPALTQVNESFLQTIQNDNKLMAIDGLVKQQQYRLLDALLNKHGIGHMAFKGVYLAEHGYPDPSLRISGDIDVLVDQSLAFRAIEILQAEKYSLSPKHQLYFQDGEQKLLDDLYEVSLFKQVFNNPIDIDLHWKILCFNKDYAGFDLSYIQSQPTHSHELQVVLLVSHHGVTNIWQQIYYINDLYFLLNGKPTDWLWLLAEMRRYGLERVFLVGLYWCQELWSLAMPETIRNLLADDAIRSLANGYEANWESDEPIEFSPLVLSQLTFFAKTQQQTRKKLKIYATFATSRVFRASTFKIGKQLVYIPREFGPITVFIRAIRSFSRFFVPAK